MEMEAEEGFSVSRQEAIDRKGKAIVVEKIEKDLEVGEKAIVEETIEEVKDLPEAAKVKENTDASMFVGEEEKISNLISEYMENSTEWKKIKLLAENYGAFRRIKNDDGLFYDVFLFAYVEHIWKSRDRDEVERLRASLTLCKYTNDIRGKPCARFEEYSEMFVQLLNEQIEGNLRPRSLPEFLTRIRLQWPLTSICSLLHQIASNESARQAAEVLASPRTDYNKVHEIFGRRRSCFPYQRQLSVLSDALGVPVRVVLLDDQADMLGRLKIYHEDYSPSNEWKMPEWSRRPFPPDFISPDEMEGAMQAARVVPTANPRQILLFRPTAQTNHWDILYPNLT